MRCDFEFPCESFGSAGNVHVQVWPDRPDMSLRLKVVIHREGFEDEEVIAQVKRRDAAALGEWLQDWATRAL